MSQRKCIFTGLLASLKDNLIPNKCSEDVLHNWANNVPCSSEYARVKNNRMPDEFEMKAVEYFQKLEITKLKLEYYENRLAEIQKELIKRIPDKPKMSNRKKKAIENAVKLKEILEESDKEMNEILNKDTKGIWG